MQQPEEHAGSYYAASAIKGIQFPALSGDVQTDVCIVGGGFTGVATALELSERGYKVVLLEANRISWGASGRNGGQLIGGISGEERMIAEYKKRTGKDVSELMYEMSWSGNRIIRERIRKYNIQCDFKDGYVDVGFKPRHLRDFYEWEEELKESGFPHEIRVVEREELTSLIGTDLYFGGIVNMYNGHLHPLNLCLSEAKAASALGAWIYEQSPALDIQHGAKPKVKTHAGSVEANMVLLSGGAYHRLERSSLGGKLFPAGSYIIATEPLGDELASEILPSDYAVCESTNILDYYRLSADKRMLYGGRCNYSGRDPQSIKATMLPRMLRAYPKLKDVKIDYEWGGKIGIIINRVPMLGKSADNVFYAQGYSGHGVNVSHIVGNIMADAMTGTMERFDIFNSVPHIPIPGGQWFGNQMVALGMLYYRMKDLLP